MTFKKKLSLVALASVLVLAGCGDDQASANNDTQTGTQDEYVPPLTDESVLLAGAPKNDSLPNEGKSDAVYPPKFEELVALQSSVKSQGARGVCSIFSSVGLMEHLYIKEGTHLNPDFSEQYLNWSAKVQEGAFPNTGGSTASDNLSAVVNYGVVEEDVWPYENDGWTSSNDEACGEDNKPTRCYTNGEPPAEAESAQKWELPSSRWVSTRPDDIKAYMSEKEAGVVVGLTFFYQSWNHGSSQLPTSDDYSHNGYVTYPNETDKEKSLESRAGHSILLVGWDDTLEVQRLDEEGEPMVDGSGEPVMDKGFFIFKNSWGTGGFGKNSPHGDGYGFISMEYVEEYGSGRVAEMPDFETPTEICVDGLDNDGNGAVDCEDSTCTDHASCQTTTDTQVYTNGESVAIPDNDENGIMSTIDVANGGQIGSLAVNLDITHSYVGDISVMLEDPSGATAVLIDSSDSSEDDLQRTIVVDQFNGSDAQGTWTLHVWDGANYDEGTLNEWSLEVTY
jgi:C1A family cysteine protease